MVRSWRWSPAASVSGVQKPVLIEEALTRSVIGAFFAVYNALGYGFLEHLYVMALERELIARGHRVAREVWVTVYYQGQELGKQRLDRVVDDVLVVECKSTERLAPFASRQVFNYLRAMSLKVGLVLHFGPEKAQFKRVVHESAKIR